MGSANGCLGNSSTPKTISEAISRKGEEGNQALGYGIIVTPNQGLLFRHAPLYKDQALFQKFNEGSTRPEQVNLSCMVSDFKLSVSKGVIKTKVINQNPVDLWVICGGTQKASITGLTVKMDQVTWCGCIKINTSSSVDGQWHAAKPKTDWSQCTIITVILTQVSQKTSLFIYNVFSMKGQKKRQKIEWNSLSFNLRDIYKSNQKENLKESLGDQCISCSVQKADCIFLPCRHMCLCNGCIQEHKKISKRCPCCEKQYRTVIAYKDEDPKFDTFHQILQDAKTGCDDDQ